MKLKQTVIAISAIIATQTALAKTLDPIIVTSDFRPAAVEETPGSITVVNDLELEKRGAQHIEHILNLAPNVNSAAGASRSRFYQIRGIGERSQFNTPLNPSVGLNIDGIDYSRSGGAGTLFDVKQVEVLRGPQGTRFGSSSLAGMINIHSNEATENPEGKVEVTIGSQNTKALGVVASGPLSEDKSLLGRIAIHKHTSDGYMENDYLDKKDTQNEDELTGKAHLKWKASEELTFDLNLLHLDIDNGYDGFTFDNSYTTLSDEPGSDTINSKAFALKTTWKMNPATIMETTITKADSDLTYSFDGDWVYPNFHPWGYNAVAEYDRSRNNKSIDIRFMSSDNGRIFNDSTDWVAGVYYFGQDEDMLHTADWLDAPYSNEYNTKNMAAYGQLDHHLNDKTVVTAGVRVEKFDADFNSSNDIKTDHSETLYGGKLALTHEISEQHQGFINLSRGYKSGGINDDPRLSPANFTFDTEYLWNLETGVNSSLLNNDLKTRLTLFYTQRSEQQVNSSTQIPNSPDFIIYLDNAAKSEHYGIEAEADWDYSSNLRLTGSLGLLSADFVDYTYVDPNDTSNTINLNSREQAHAPSYQFSIGAEYMINNNWMVAANIEGKDKFYFSNSHDQESDAYNLVNASLEYSKDELTARLWARNLLDKEYDVRGFYFGNDPSINYEDALYVQKGAPRTFGLTVSYDY